MGLNVPVVGSDGMGSPKLAQIAGKKNATNVYYTTHFSTKSKEPEVVKFLKPIRLSTVKNRQPSAPWLTTQFT